MDKGGAMSSVRKEVEDWLNERASEYRDEAEASLKGVARLLYATIARELEKLSHRLREEINEGSRFDAPNKREKKDGRK